MGALTLANAICQSPPASWHDAKDTTEESDVDFEGIINGASFYMATLINLHLSIRSKDVQDDYALRCGRTQLTTHVIVNLSATKIKC